MYLSHHASSGPTFMMLSIVIHVDASAVPTLCLRPSRRTKLNMKATPHSLLVCSNDSLVCDGMCVCVRVPILYSALCAVLQNGQTSFILKRNGPCAPGGRGGGNRDVPSIGLLCPAAPPPAALTVCASRGQFSCRPPKCINVACKSILQGGFHQQAPNES